MQSRQGALSVSGGGAGLGAGQVAVWCSQGALVWWLLALLFGDAVRVQVSAQL